MFAPEQMISSTSNEHSAARPARERTLNARRQPGDARARLTPAQRFMGASLLILLGGMAGVGWWISSQIEHGVLSRTASTTALYVDSFISQPLQGMATSDQLTPDAVAELERLLTTTTLGKEVAAFKVWGPGGRVVYSADPALLDRTFPVGEQLQAAWDGRVTAEFSTLEDEENIRERPQADRLLEIYSPVRAHGSGDVIAVAEFYQRVDELDALISAAQQRSWLILLAVTLTMYLLLGGHVHRASATIVRQAGELRAQVARLEELLAQNEDLGERVRRAAARSTAYNERFLRRIGAELHDGPAQYLSLALLRLDRVADTCERQPDHGRASEDVEQIRATLGQAMQELRGISAGLGLPQLDQIATSDVVVRAVRAHERRTGSRVEMRLGEVPGNPCQATRITLYRVVQEGLSNAFRHAGGVGQRVDLCADDDRLHLCVSDEGTGFEPPPPGEWGEHMGLAGMRERVESLGGEFAILVEPGVGTRVVASLPLQIVQEPYV